MKLDILKQQIDTTLSNIEHDTVGREDRVFLTHLLEELRLACPIIELDDALEIADEFITVVGSTQGLIEDGLIQD